MASSVANILATAKQTAADAEKKFPSSGAPHEYSNAPYSVARAASPTPKKSATSGIDKSVSDIGKTLRYKAEQVDALTK